MGGRRTGDALPEATGTFHLPRALVTLASVAIQAREPDRFGLLYALVWRSHAGEKLLEDSSDPDLSLARRLALAVRADAHRMRTNMRFLPVAMRKRVSLNHGPGCWAGSNTRISCCRPTRN